MFYILIRRCVKEDKEEEFLRDYNQTRPNHPDFIDETLTKVRTEDDLPPPMRSLPLAGEGCITYVNVARWRSAKSFEQHFNPQTMHDPSYETADRLRVVLEIVGNGSAIASN